MAQSRIAAVCALAGAAVAGCAQLPAPPPEPRVDRLAPAERDTALRTYTEEVERWRDDVARLEENRDFYEATNRRIDAANTAVYRYSIDPLADGFNALPDGARAAVGGVFDNLRESTTFVNQVLQGKIVESGATLARATLNSTVGLLGLWEPAEALGLERVQEDFGQTLGVWGVGEGSYVVLPVFGPSTTRDSVGLVVDTVANPLNLLGLPTAATVGRGVGDAVTLRGETIEQERAVRRDSLDSYAVIRSAYRQRRAVQINDGEIPLDTLDVPGAEPMSTDDLAWDDSDLSGIR